MKHLTPAQTDLLKWIMQYGDDHVDEHGRRQLPYPNQIGHGKYMLESLIRDGYLDFKLGILMPTAKADAWWARWKRSRRKLFLDVEGNE